MAASLGNATVNVLARTVLFEQSLKRSLKRMSAATAAIFAGVAAANFFGGAIKDAMSLELRVARIATLMEGVDKASQEAFNAARIREFSNEIGISADKVAESIYYMIGSGVELKDTYAAVRAASNVAVATNTDLKFSADFVSTALNAMGGTTDRLTKQVLDSAHATDIFFAALKEGKGEPRELAQFISTAVPAAKGLAISYGEVNAAMAAGTLLGTKARKVTTGLSYIMRGLGNEGKGVGEAFKEITGTGFADWAKKSENQGNALQKAIKILGTEVGLGKISNIGGAETGLEAIKLLLTVWPQYVAIQKEVAGAGGDADRAVDKVNKTLSRQVDILKNKFSNFRGSVGDWLGPVLYDAIVKFDAFWTQFWPPLKAKFVMAGEWIQSKWDALKAFFNGDDLEIGGLILLVEPIKTALGNIVENIRSAFTLAQSLWTSILWPVLQGLVGAFLWVAAAIGPPVLMVFNALSDAWQAFVGFIAANQTTVQAIVIVLGAMAIGAGAAVIAFNLHMLAIIAWTTVTGIATGVTGFFTGAVAALNAMMYANPIGLVIGLIVGLGLAFMLAWKKSEKFQRIVKKAFNAVVAAAGAAAKFLVSAVGKYVDTVLLVFQKILEGLAHLPDWLGGGKANGAAEALGRLRADVSATVDYINGQIDRITKKIQVNVEINLKTVKDYAGRTSTDRLALLNKGIDPDTVDLKGKALGGIPGSVSSSSSTSGGGAGTPYNFDGGGYGGGGGGGAADAAKEAAAKIKDALKRVITDLNRIAKNTSKQSAETIKENFKTLYADLLEGGKKNLIPGIKKVEKQLLKLASRRDGLGAKYKGVWTSFEDLKDKLKELKDESKAFTDGIKQQVREMGNVSDESKGLGTTYLGIRGQLRGAIAQTKQFTAYIDKLRKMKLNDTSLRQLIEAGPQAGMQSAKALVQAGQAGVNEVDKLQSQLDAAGAKLATSANDQFYKAGIAVAQGLVKGLEKEEKAILKAMDSIADKLVVSIKKKLGIKSPSVVFGEIGENISKGLAGGIAAKGGGAVSAATNITNDIKVAVHGVSDPNAARRAGILSGQGIQNVLARQRVDLVTPVI